MTDVRMRGFQQRSTVAEVWRWLDGQLRTLPAETISLSEAAGRVLAEDVVSRFDVPGFQRSMMDGYAVQAADTEGASDYNPLPLKIVGQSLPGRAFAAALQAGQAVRIMTGAPLPEGADAVAPVEKTQLSGEQRVEVLEPLPRGKNVGRIGEDVSRGATVLAKGRRLRPQDLGVLSSIGVARVQVVSQPTVRLIVTGDELLPPGSAPAGYRVVNANSPMLAALVTRDGGRLLAPSGHVPDQPDAILAALRAPADVVLVSGGSSVGQEDYAPSLLRQHGELAHHGVAMRPSSPAGLGRLEQRLVFLLPGNPVSCLCAYDFFAGRAIRGLGGRALDWPYRRNRFTLGRKLVSVVGRVDYARVRVENDRVLPLAISGASMLSSTTRGDGFVIVPQDSEGYPEGADVVVFLYDQV